MVTTELHLDLNAAEIERIVGFLGYGRPSAPIWFIGIEEGLGKADSEEAIANLKARGNFEPVMDLREAHLLLKENSHVIDIEKKNTFTQVWTWMAKIVAACKGSKGWRELDAAKEYVRYKLGRSKGETFLTELSPIPAADTSDDKWMTWFKDHDPELERKIEQRAAKLQEMLVKNKPPLVVCYGKNLGDRFAELLNIKWPGPCPAVCLSNDGKRVLIPFLGNGQIGHAVIEQVFVDGDHT